MTKPMFTGLALLVLVSSSAGADCIYPPAPAQLPNGYTASAEEMSAATHDFKAFNAAINSYTACIDQEAAQKISDGGSKLTAEQVKKINADAQKKHDAAVDDLQQRVTGFNAEIRAYKSRQQ